MSRHHHERDDAGNVPWSSADSRNWRKIIGATLPARCTRCPRLVLPSDLWDVDHIRSAGQGGGKTADNLGPAHRSCNRSHGGKQGAAKANRTRRTQQRLAPW